MQNNKFIFLVQYDKYFPLSLSFLFVSKQNLINFDTYLSTILHLVNNKLNYIFVFTNIKAIKRIGNLFLLFLAKNIDCLNTLCFCASVCH